jgi:predicted MFS family arabinose efflux permease
MRRAAAGLRRRVGHRGSALLFFAVLDLIYCHALAFPSEQARRSESLRFLAGLLPLWAWAAVWGGVGLLCLVQAFRRRDQTAFSAAIGLKVMWGGVSLGGWLIGHVDRGYVNAAVWLTFAAFVAIIASWPEPPRGWKDRAWTQPSGD